MSETTHGGKRRRAGRTTELGRGVKTKRTNLSLDPDTLRFAAAMGAGKSLSQVVREAIREKWKRYQSEP